LFFVAGLRGLLAAALRGAAALVRRGGVDEGPPALAIKRGGKDIDHISLPEEARAAFRALCAKTMRHLKGLENFAFLIKRRTL
jgi:hypothetical protein